MTVILNGKPITCKEEETLTNFLNRENIDTLYLAVAVDDIVISRTEWASFILKDNSKILLIKATQGG